MTYIHHTKSNIVTIFSYFLSKCHHHLARNTQSRLAAVWSIVNIFRTNDRRASPPHPCSCLRFTANSQSNLTSYLYVCEVQIVGLGGVLCCEGVYLVCDGQDAIFLAPLAD